MDLIKNIIEKAKTKKKTIILPEAGDHRILIAARKIQDMQIAKIVLIGQEIDVFNLAKSHNIDLKGIDVTDPLQSDHLQEFINTYFERRVKKGITLKDAEKIMKQNTLFFGAMMVDRELADGMVAGASNSTGNTLKSVFHCIGTKQGFKTVSSFFIMVSKNEKLGDNGICFFADCAVNPNPAPEQLAEIAISTADNFKNLMNKEPVVALLSYSTMGSAKNPDAKKVVEAVAIAKNLRPDILLDGEMQADAAIIPSVAEKKASLSKVAGKANVLIFPDLDAGNIGYKLTQRFGNTEAIGPILQGARKPVNDLSRGCSIDDIINVTAFTCLQCEA